MARELSIPPDELARQKMRIEIGRNAAELDPTSTTSEQREPELPTDRDVDRPEQRKQ